MSILIAMDRAVCAYHMHIFSYQTVIHHFISNQTIHLLAISASSNSPSPSISYCLETVERRDLALAAVAEDVEEVEVVELPVEGTASSIKPPSSILALSGMLFMIVYY